MAPLPEGISSAVAAADGGRAIKLSAQALVIGTGAGGAAAFCALAEAGVDVLAVELGSHVAPELMSGRSSTTWPSLLAEAGGRGSEDFGVTVFQGRGVGGSTLLSSNLAHRPPTPILQHWADRWGLTELASARFTDRLAAMERTMGVAPIDPALVNTNNQKLLDGMQRLGYAGGLMRHSREGCRASGLCALGCPNDAKLNAARVHIPRALKAGGRLLVEARVDRVQRAGDAVCGVSGYAVDPRTRIDVAPFVIHAPLVIVAGGASASFSILRRSYLPDPHGLAGNNLHLNPSAAVIGIFDGPDDEPVRGWLGLPQAVECTELFDPTPGSQRRVWLASGFAHPALMALSLPGFGPELAAMMRLYPRMASIHVLVHDQTSGRIVTDRGERVHMRYRLDEGDLQQLALGMREAARLLLAAGARRVLFPLSPPLWIANEDDLHTIDADNLGPHNPRLTSTNPSSTLWMGLDPASSVVDPHGAHHHCPGLFIADASLLPTSLGLPPQLLIATLGHMVAEAAASTL